MAAQRERESQGGQRDSQKSVGHLLKTSRMKDEFIRQRALLSFCGEDVPSFRSFKERLLRIMAGQGHEIRCKANERLLMEARA